MSQKEILQDGPPIIIKGSSVIIESKDEFVQSYDTTKKKHIYTLKDVVVKKIKLKNKAGTEMGTHSPSRKDDFLVEIDY